MLHELAAVPGQEEVAIIRVPAAAVAYKEARLPGRRIVVPAVMRPIIAPAKMMLLRQCTLAFGCETQVLQT